MPMAHFLSLSLSLARALATILLPSRSLSLPVSLPLSLPLSRRTGVVSDKKLYFQLVVLYNKKPYLQLVVLKPITYLSRLLSPTSCIRRI